MCQWKLSSLREQPDSSVGPGGLPGYLQGSSLHDMDWAICKGIPSLQEDKRGHPGTPVSSKAGSPPYLPPIAQLIAKSPSALDQTKQNYKEGPKSDFHCLPDFRFFKNFYSIYLHEKRNTKKVYPFPLPPTLASCNHESIFCIYKLGFEEGEGLCFVF